MIRRILRQVFDYVCQKIVDLNHNILAKGFMEINPRYYDDMLVQSHLVEHWINNLNAQMAQAKIKEHIHKEGIARCNYLIQEVLPIISTAMSLLKQSIDYNAHLQQQPVLHENSRRLNPSNSLVKNAQVPIVDDDGKIRFQNLNLMLSDTFERLGEKRNEINQWLSEARTNPELIPEA